ncbi:hypothetical protein M8J76_005004 [Diaphorina citri]|nr:hypothetical protein M8J76_005004 [Diaphorina citri]
MSKVIPTPRSWPIFGTLISILKEGGGKQLHRYVEKRHQELGPIYKEKIGPVEAYFLNDTADVRKVFALEGTYPEHILPQCWEKYRELYGCDRGLYFMDGPEWMKYRKIMNKYLLKNYSAGPQQELTKELFKAFEHDIVESTKANNKPSFESHLYQLSINFIIAHMLGTPFISHYKELSKEIHDLSQVVHKIFEHSAALSMLPINLSIKLKLSAWTKFVESVHQSLALASELLHKMEPFNGDGLSSKLKEVENVSPELIRRMVIDFILAAGDTTAISTQWIFYLLGRHPSVQDQLYQELQKNNDCLNNEIINHVIREGLRMYPIAPFISRFMPKDVEIRGYLIPKGSLVLLSVFSSSHNPAYFPSPEQFQPSRWKRDANKKYVNVVEPYASLPYAMGARSCVGRKLAQTQMCLTIAQIVNNYHIKVDKPVDVVLKMIPVPSEPIKFQLIPR